MKFEASRRLSCLAKWNRRWRRFYFTLYSI